ncbi:MAG: asparagine synthase C-terminal domain-containing protein, partial [Planctomycetota bacterium]
ADIVQDSIVSHLRSDVALCSMLSGGLDSTVIAAVAHDRVDELRTYCAGASNEDDRDSDPMHAAEVAALLGTTHTTAMLDEHSFSSLWVDTVQRTGLPLATPNEIAIRLVARTLRRDGQVVTLSGEGADELFAGYDGPLTAAAASTVDGAQHELEANAWVPADIKPLLLVGDIGRAAADQDPLLKLYTHAFNRANAGTDPDAPLSLRHLRFQRDVNLPMLLHRLDSATMLESVEGRTPFADCRVASAAAALSMRRLFDPSGTTPATRTKLALRRAFNDSVPEPVMHRPKASFPVPFAEWMGHVVSRVRSSSAGASLVQPTLLAALTDNPQAHWHLAWPIFNLVLWAERWWGQSLNASYETADSTLGTASRSRLV